MGPRTSLNLYEGMSVAENAFINIKNHTYTITANIEVGANSNGVIIAQAGKFGGWALYTKGGKLNHEYNYFGLERTRITSSSGLSPGKHVVKYEFIAAEAKPGTGGKCILYIDDQKVAESQIPKTQPFLYSADEGVDVGMDGETNVSNDYKQMDNKFNGKINKITVDVKPSQLSEADKKLLEQKDIARRAAE
jgi:arylsulfatase